MTEARLFSVVRTLGELSPSTPEPEPDLERAVDFLGWPVDAGTVLRAGDAVAVAVGLALTLGLTLVAGPVVAATTALAVGLGVSTAARYLPRWLATARRTRALGEAPDLVSRAVLRMRLSPSPETAAAFAADREAGPLSDSLGAHVRRADGTGQSGLSAFADEWAAWFPALRRAFTLVESAGAAEAVERERALDSALAVTLQGTQERAAEFAAAIRGPATAMYAFGVLLPLALVAMLPTAGTVGVDVPLAAVVVGYDLLLPVGLLVAGGWLLARRPVAFPPPSVPRSHADVPDRRWPAVAAGSLTAVCSWVLASRLVAPWTGALAAPAAAMGVALVVAYRPTTRVRERVDAVEEGLPDALSLVGREVGRGRSVEVALDDAVDLLESATGEVLADATRRQRQLRVGVRESLLGERGALATVPSQRARSTAELLAVAADAGRPAGPAIVAMADHLDDLRSVEATVRRDLREVTSTLSNTAAVFGPLVGGATVTLAERMSADGPLTASISPAALGVAVGVYVLALAVILTVLATGLERGLERSLVGYRVGRALCSSTAVFIAALVATRALV